jgi:hypothetical protein
MALPALLQNGYPPDPGRVLGFIILTMLSLILVLWLMHDGPVRLNVVAR